MIRISPPGREADTSGSDDTPLLSLTHFSRPPFVTFGCVEPGVSRSADLVLQNPSPEPAYLTVYKLPTHRGFTVPDTDILIPPFESVPLTITWTPLEEGGVRELVTFLVNDVVKHQAVLLGSAELPSKKKRARWNTKKRKPSPVGPKLSRPKNKDLCSTVIKNKTFNAKHKNGQGFSGAAKNPLQSCENLSKPNIRGSRVKKGRRSRENKAPMHYDSPVGNDLQAFIPGSLKRSKTYSILCTTEYETMEELKGSSTIHRDFVEEQWTLTEHRVNKLSISPINPEHGLQHNFTCTPSLVNDFKTLSPTEFYNAELAVRHTDHPSEKSRSRSFQESFHECFTKMSLKTLTPPSVLLTPPSVLLTPPRKVLSPDSFVSNSYASDEYLDAVNLTPVLSPDQFVKDNFLTPPVVEVKTSTFRTEPVDEIFSPRTSGNLDPTASRLTYCVKKKRARDVPLLLSDGSSVAKNTEKSKINSATVTKARSSDCRENVQRPQLKSRRRLRCVEGEDEACSQSDLLEQLPIVAAPALPVISVSRPTSCSESPLPKDTAKSIRGHKRRSADISGGSSSESLNVQAKRSHLSKPSASQRGNIQDREQETKRAFSTPTPWKIHITKSESKGKPTLVKSRQIDKTRLSQLHSTVVFKHSKSVVAVPQSKLTFMKSTKTVIPRHPMPFAAKNMFYDERWMAKQERGFTWWLNFILTPDDFAVKTDAMKVNAAALILGSESARKVSVPKAPTKEEVSMKAYTARCRLNRLRRSACRLFTSDPVVKAIRRLEVEIEARRLLVRKDRHLWKDVGERQKILIWLLSYNPLWLRVGLETTFGELISLEDNNDVTGLALFILNRLLWNPDIAAEYRHNSVPHLYRDGHEEALSKFTLKKLLLLVFFLDYAKQSRLIDHDPCLFCKDAEFKTSKDLLLAFSRDFLSGEGDLSRHLGYLGLPVSHVQTPLDEFDFAVTNLAVNLQCGVRLVRMMELLTHNWSLSKKLRVPAISRLQKMHNVEVALDVLTDRGVQIKDERGNAISSKDIVDRHRERTLALLWTIVLTFQVEVVLNVDHLKEEIKFLKHSCSTQKKLAALRALSFPAVPMKRDSIPFLPENYSEQVLLLMEWINAICAFYNTKVENFTVSFSDGRVFCYLINHYHPSYVALDAIRQQTTQTIECNETGTVGLNSSSDSDNSVDMWSGMCDGFTTSALYKELLANERTNFTLLQTAVSNLGGIPAMIHHSDTSNTIPDEKIVITFLSFLCARLLDLRKEARAARVIQAAWRKYKLTTEEQLLQKKHKAASVIQIAVRKFLSRRWILKRTTSAIVIQKHWRKYLAYKELMKLKLCRQKKIEASAAIVIQRIWRCYAARKYYIKLRKCVVLLQARVRTKRAVLAYKKTMHATRTLQRHVRAWLLAKKDRENFLQFKSAALTIQSAFRRWRCIKLKQEINAVLVLQKAYRKWQNRNLEMKRKAATLIQSLYRMSRERCKYLSMRAAAVKIQSLVKMRPRRIQYLVLREKVIFVQTQFRANLLMRKERKSFLQMRAASVKIQSNIKGLLVRKQIKLWNKAATTLQANYRMHMTRRKYLAIYRAAVIIQESFRANKVAAYHRESFLLMKCSAIWIQAACRGYIVRKRIKIQHLAALSIQTTYRCYVARKHYIGMRQSAISIQRWYRGQKQLKGDLEQFGKIKRAVATIQSAYRGWLVRRQLQKWTMAAVTIQSAYRRCIAQSKFKEVKMATLTIQRYYRAVLIGREERQKYLHICLLISKVQATWRGKKVRQEIQTQHKMATLIQSYYRMHVCYTKYKTMTQAAVLIQRHYRAHTAGKAQRANYLNVKEAANRLQAAFRGWQIRKHLLHLHNAACKIQTTYRSFRLRKEYLSLKMATIFIQRRYRALVAAKLQRKSFLCLRKSTIKLQSVYRGKRTRQRIIQMQRSAVLLQSVFKMQKQRAQYRKMKKATLLIQKHYRAIKEGKEQQQQYLALRKSACTLQAAFRGWQIRKHLLHLHNAACKIQTSYRSFRLRKEYLGLKMATIFIQRRYRTLVAAKLQRKSFLCLRKNTIKLQSVYRGMRTRQRIIQMQRSAVLLQSVFKMQKQRAQYRKMKRASLVIQKHYRAVKEGRKQQRQYLALKKSACTLQAAFRGWQIRKHLLHLHNAACKIQTSYRSFRLRKEYLGLRMATILIQKRYRAMVATKLQRKGYLLIRQNTIKLQSVYRGMRTRQRINQMQRSAVLLQSVFKMQKQRAQYRKMKQASLVIQKHYRAVKEGRKQHQQYLALKKSACTLQASFRGWQIRKHLLHLHNAACKIQTLYRSFRLRKEYLSLRTATILIQRRYCAMVAAKVQRKWYLLLRQNTIKLQSVYRGMRTRQRIIQMKKAAVIIQKQYRAMKEGRKQQQQYLALKKAAVTLQAAWRGKKARNRICRMHTAAIEIQAWYRMVKQQQTFKNLKNATVTVQNLYRASQERKKQLLIFQNKRKAILCIQSTFRTVKLQREFRAKRQAVVVIQRTFKSCLARRRFLALQKATVCIQRRFRTKKLADRQRQDYLKTRRAALVLQAAFRGFQVRQKLRQINSSATVIQAAFRMHKERVAYLKLKQSAITIQQYYRAYKISACERETFVKQKKSAVMIQSAYRGAKVRQRISQMNKAAFTIQATFKMHQCRIQYKKFLWAVYVIQQRYRANKQRDFHVLRYSFIKDATLLIQAAYRGWHVRKELETMTGAATVIQKQFRTYLKRKQYLLIQSSALLIQRWYRATALMRRCHSQYRSLRKSAVCIQASYRGFKVRKDLALKHEMAIRIQSAFRNHKALVLYRSQQDAARKIQAWYRSSIDSRHTRTSFLKLRRAAIVLQAGYRGMSVRKNLKVISRAATVIQSNYRMYTQKKYYKSLVKATQTVHQRYRAKKTERDLCYQATNHSAVLLQAAFRGMKVRRQLKKMHCAATTIQRFVKGYFERKKYLKLRSATVFLQRRYRASVLARSFLAYRKPVMCLQSAYRACKEQQRLESMFRLYTLQNAYGGQRTSTVLQQNYYIYQTYVLLERECYLRLQNAAVVLQASYRGMKSRRNISKMHNAATIIQAFYRMHRQRKSYLIILQATKTLQLHFRATLLKNEAVKRYNDLRDVVLSIQQAFRAKKSRDIKAAVVIQTTWKMYRERRAFIKAKSAVVRLQAAFRGFRTRKRHQLLVESACHIQSWYRRCCQAHLHRVQYLSIRTSAIIIQSAFRGWVARKRVKQERVARILQSYYRMAVCRKQFLQLRASTIKLQTCYRMQRTMQMYKKQRAAALIIQKWYKSLLAMRCQRAAFLNARKQIILVQAAVRRFNAKRLFKRIQHAALMSQIAKWNTERRLLRFASAVYHHLCAVKIQRWFWSRLTLKKAQKQICHVIYIQRWYRSRLQRRKFLCMHEKLVRVQHVVRSWLHRRNEAAVRIQRCVRGFLQRKQQAKVSGGIVKFQALWRSYQWRKENETKKMRTLRQRLRKLSEETRAEDKLCNRTSVALNYLLTYKHFTYILAALKHLEAATRLSSICCERMAQSGAVSTIFTLIRSCNRSIPCMEVITLSIQVLLNLTKYEKTVSTVHEVEDSVEVLLNLMQIYREKAGDKVPEKGGSIFTKTCCLLAIFGLDPHRAKEIYAIPKAMNRISSLYVLTSRKHKMDTARNVSKQLMNNTRIHGNTSSLHTTPFHTRIVSRIKPDWVLRKDNMREIVDPLQAIQLVMSTFGLPI
ncbi:abnormal spindle-like microcephaly-associated protein [Rana temporaria]|uniref:abnormal spindle-like microcephaly-associated protein n=1 Tax=Rana temporaria TaxID=8407 RepID=UPI001AACFA8D|nr:abnormal spindle-like microcephaly-associated protein [Rana temporaria]